MKFIRSDGVALELCPEIKAGIRNRPSANPTGNELVDWTEKDYAPGARVKLDRWRNRLSKLRSLGVSLEGKRVLEVACGNGIDAMLLALEPVERVVGVDIRLPLYLANKKGARHRRLASEVLAAVGKEADVWKSLCDLPICLAQADATNLVFEDNSFDLILSKSFLEHMIPLATALQEMERVLAPGGVMYHVLDPFYWLRGCHNPALVDIPWAHARLLPNEYRRFVTESEGAEAADRRCQWLESLNHFTPNAYRRVFDDSRFEVLRWKETRSQYAEEILSKLPDVLDSVIAGVSCHDLVCDSIRVLARKRGTTVESQ